MKYPTFQISIPANFRYLSIINNFWKEVCIKTNICKDLADDIAVAIEENCVNIIRYAYSEKTDKICLSIKIEKTIIEIVVKDWGKAFNPKILANAQMPDPETAQQTGKMGLPLMKTLFDKVQYSRTPKGMNCWKLVKNRKSEMKENIETEQLNNFSVLVKVEGSLDYEGARALRPKIKELVEKNKLIVVDMSNVTFLASEGLGIFLYASKDLQKKQGQLWLVNPQEQVHKVFKLTRVENMFRFYDNMEDVKKDLPTTSN